MKIPESDQDQPIAWTAVEQDTPVYARDGTQVGAIFEMLGAEDIFHGIVVTAGVLTHEVEISASHVTGITRQRIDTDLSSQEIRDLPVYEEESSFKLGFTGILGRKLGWVRDKDTNGPD